MQCLALEDHVPMMQSEDFAEYRIKVRFDNHVLYGNNFRSNRRVEVFEWNESLCEAMNTTAHHWVNWHGAASVRGYYTITWMVKNKVRDNGALAQMLIIHYSRNIVV